MPDASFSVIDDCGLMGIVDAANYTSFVHSDWTYEMLLDHFRGALLHNVARA